MPSRCAKCGSDQIALEGLGTEKLEETLKEAFPEARERVIRYMIVGEEVVLEQRARRRD